MVAGPGVPVTNGLFTVTLDFGTSVFTGPARWLEIGVRTNGGGSYSLAGGFWGIISAIQTPGAPLLTIRLTQTNAVVVPGRRLRPDSLCSKPSIS